jgi:hypothetical protein
MATSQKGIENFLRERKPPQQNKYYANCVRNEINAQKKFERLRRFTAQPLVSSFEPDGDVLHYEQRKGNLPPPRIIRRIISKTNQVAVSARVTFLASQ